MMLGCAKSSFAVFVAVPSIYLESMSIIGCQRETLPGIGRVMEK